MMVTGASRCWWIELRQVVDVAGHRVAAVRRPLAVAVPPQVGGDDVPVVPERLRRPVPVPAVVPPAVDQEQRRLVGIAPVHVVQAAGAGRSTCARSVPACCRSSASAQNSTGSGPAYWPRLIERISPSKAIRWASSVARGPVARKNQFASGLGQWRPATCSWAARPRSARFPSHRHRSPRPPREPRGCRPTLVSRDLKASPTGPPSARWNWEAQRAALAWASPPCPGPK